MNIKNVSFILLILIPFQLFCIDQSFIEIIWPKEMDILPPGKNFIFGNIKDPSAELKINGMKVPVHPDGGFIAFLPTDTTSDLHQFVFKCEAYTTSGHVESARTVIINPSAKPLTGKAFSIHNFNQTRFTLTKEQTYILEYHFSPGMRGTARFTDSLSILSGDLLTLQEDSPGVYRTEWKSPSTDQKSPFRLILEFYNDDKKVFQSVSNCLFTLPADQPDQTTDNLYCRTLKESPVPMTRLVLKDMPAIDPESVYPDTDWIVNAGDTLNLGLRARPGSKVTLSLVNQEGKAVEPIVPVIEKKIMIDGKEFPSGIYQCQLTVKNSVFRENTSICYTITDEIQTFTVEAPGKIIIDPSIQQTVVRLKEKLNIALNDVKGTYFLFLPTGLKLPVIGKRGNLLCLKISVFREVWIDQSKVEFLPKGEVSENSVINMVNHRYNHPSSIFSLSLSEPRPYQIIHTPELKQIKIRIFGAISFTDWIFPDEKDPWLSSIRWDVPEKEVYELTIQLKDRQLWGYDLQYRYLPGIHYKSSASWFLDFSVKHRKKSMMTFNDLTICIDPGHSPASGAVGPTGLKERDVNLLIALELKKMLEQNGAKIVMTRTDNSTDLPNDERRDIARNNHCDLFVSIHNNALPPGMDPFLKYGTSVLYYYPMSQFLSDIMLKHLLRQTRLPSSGSFYACINMVRNHYMPSVLIEGAYMMLPEQETLLKKPSFRIKIAKAAFNALQEFILYRH